MEPNRPPPRHASGTNSKINSQTSDYNAKRAQFAKGRRNRSVSTGSTRGAFGPIDVNDAHNDKEIYDAQHMAIHGNLNRINSSNNAHPRNLNSSIDQGHRQNQSRPERIDVDYGENSYENNQPSNIKTEDVSPKSRRHQRMNSFDSTNAGFTFSHHTPTSADLKARATQEAEMRNFSKFSTYGTQNNDSYEEDSYDESADGEEDESFLAHFMKTVFYNPDKPEFTSLQQSSWAVLIGIFMGILTAYWGQAVETSVEFFWVTLPRFLYEQGVFTDLDGHLPLPHYMWICPTIFGGVLAYVTAEYGENGRTIPGQNEWIEGLHRVGLMEHKRFWPCLIISTLGMASGLSLGPEMPLVLVAGMVGSFVALKTHQSVLSSRVMNLTAAAAGIGGLFNFPMAGALFVLELPHRMGLQYFEALSPAVLSSIISVLVNRVVAKKEKVEGYFDYPFLAESLPSNIFYTAVIYGIVGTFVGVLYAEGVLFCKWWVHEWFHVPHDDHDHDEEEYEDDGLYDNERDALIQSHRQHSHHAQKKKPGCIARMCRCYSNFFGIEHEPTRAACAGIVCGIIVGLNCMFLPHQLFWGEAQLQTLIDKGRTPLPVFEYDEDDELSLLTAYGYCMISPEDDREQIKGFSIPCTGLMSFTKILTIGLSLGSGICGGHFWGPLYTGCAAAHFFVDLVGLFADRWEIAKQISEFPCVAVLCIMGATHVVTYRCHTAIMLVLTLTISSFSNKGMSGSTAGDYSAVFPLLVVACYVPVFLARNNVFYKTQRCRGDIVAVAEVLCEPNKELIFAESDYSDGSYGDEDSLSTGLSDGEESGNDELDMRALPNWNGTENGKVDPLSLSLHSNTQVRKATNDPLMVSQHSAISRASRRSTRSSRSQRSSGSRERSYRSVRRGNSYGEIEEFQPNLLGQALEARDSSRPKTPPPSSTPSRTIPRHRKTSSNVSNLSTHF